MSSCGERKASEPILPLMDAPYPTTLSQWEVLELEGGFLKPVGRTTPYTLNEPLFSDYASKFRTITLPNESASDGMLASGVANLPVGTIITKSFYYATADVEAIIHSDALSLSTAAYKQEVYEPGIGLPISSYRLIETRILAHTEEGWLGLPYLWNEDQTEAYLKRTGELIDIELLDTDKISASESSLRFTYMVPNQNQCIACHAVNHTDGGIQPIGIKKRLLELDGDPFLGAADKPQLNRLKDAGLVFDKKGTDIEVSLERAADLIEAKKGDGSPISNDHIQKRARAMLDINCAHCHNSRGAADVSGLHLNIEAPLDANFGLCKPPIAAGNGTGGRHYSIVPTRPDESILSYRLWSDDPAEMMPELGRSLVYEEMAKVIDAWIADMDESRACGMSGLMRSSG